MNKVCSIFSQVLKLFSRGDFEKAVKKHQAERHARGFTSWGQFMAMLFCQLGHAHSLREICGGLACCEGQLKHLGVPVAPKKSTLAYANQHRPWELYLLAIIWKRIFLDRRGGPCCDTVQFEAQVFQIVVGHGVDEKLIDDRLEVCQRADRR